MEQIKKKPKLKGEVASRGSRFARFTFSLHRDRQCNQRAMASGSSSTNSLVIVNFNAAESLRTLLTALELSQSTTTDVIVVDNASNDDSRKMVRGEFAKHGVKLVKTEQNRGFGAA